VVNAFAIDTVDAYIVERVYRLIRRAMSFLFKHHDIVIIK